ncbi:MAG: glycosyltransferase, partial [bacterium]
QKGLDLVADAIPEFMDRMQLVILGVGDTTLQETFASLAKENPGRIFYKQGFDESLAHKIYAGADIFLMPSRFEPCGLGQLLAMRYGSLPVATRTGGLTDTVHNRGEADNSNGFVMASADREGMDSAFRAALSSFGKKEHWNRMVQNAISGDYSWAKSAQDYINLFRKAIQKVRQ